MPREAKPEDTQRMAEIHVRTWQAAYKGQVPQKALDELSVADRTERWKQILSRGESKTIVIEHDGKVVGFADCGASRDDDQELQRAGEIFALYVDTEFQRTGKGKELFAAARETLRDMGFSQFTLWVLESNEPARRFYEACGMSFDGTKKTEDLGLYVLKEVRYRGPV